MTTVSIMLALVGPAFLSWFRFFRHEHNRRPTREEALSCIRLLYSVESGPHIEVAPEGECFAAVSNARMCMTSSNTWQD